MQGGPERCLLLSSFAQNHQKFLRFQWNGNICECLTFGLGPAPRTFTKLLKSPIAVLRRIQIRTIIYLEDMLLMSQTINGLEIARDTFIFILQSLGLVTNSQKSVLVPLQKVRVSRVGNRLSESDINTTTGKKNWDWNVTSLIQTPKQSYGKWPAL